MPRMGPEQFVKELLGWELEQCGGGGIKTRFRIVTFWRGRARAKLC